jgi:hypothetical protein
VISFAILKNVFGVNVVAVARLPINKLPLQLPIPMGYQYLFFYPNIKPFPKENNPNG